jgi:molecular chaperone Hsp33
MQTRTENGVVQLLVCDYRGGEVRGYIDYDAEKLATTPEQPTLFALFGQGYLAITFDLAATGERYQGIVPLDGETLAEAAQSYFVQSEQIPSLVRVGIARDGDRTIAGGLFLQHLPEGEVGRERLHTRLDHPEWEHVEALGQTMGADELADPALSLETLVWRLFNEEPDVRVLASTPLVRGCRCTGDYIASVLAKFSLEERREMADDDGFIQVDCAFCATKFPVAAEADPVA